MSGLGGTRSFVAVALVVLTPLVACGPRLHVPSSSPHAPAEANGARDGAEEAAADDAEDMDGDVEAEDVAAGDGRCPEGMVAVETPERAFCIDRYEASLVEVTADGAEEPFPHFRPVDGHTVRAVSVAGVFPQGFISEVQAQDACNASGKRLCAYPEWKTACMGPEQTAFPYGNARAPGTCHDQGKSAVLAVFGAKAVLASTPLTPGAVASRPPPAGPASSAAKPAHVTKGRAAQTVKTTKTRTGKTASTKSGGSKATASKASTKPTKVGAAKASTKKRIAAKASARPSNVDPGVWAKLNEPGLGQVEGALARTGEHAACVNAWGVVDMVGNLHEWVATDASLAHGTFAGGYYLDTTMNGDGCHYRTVAHAHDYHDYSTGFRCCADLAPR